MERPVGTRLHYYVSGVNLKSGMRILNLLAPWGAQMPQRPTLGPCSSLLSGCPKATDRHMVMLIQRASRFRKALWHTA
eukprot:8850170-Alexandrium_andersonii.AAC.1